MRKKKEKGSLSNIKKYEFKRVELLTIDSIRKI